jgi:hypothetical protein
MLARVASFLLNRSFLNKNHLIFDFLIQFYIYGLLLRRFPGTETIILLSLYLRLAEMVNEGVFETLSHFLSHV